MDAHHRVFENFACWTGDCPPGFVTNFLGVKTREFFYKDMAGLVAGGFMTAGLPAFNEEYFEWIDLFESVESASGRFTMIELGAGWGRWLVNAAALLRCRGLPAGRFIGVEPEPTHFEWMKLHCADNAVDLTQCQLLQAAASDRDGEEWFYVGRADEWYGQALAPPPASGLKKLARRARALGRAFMRGALQEEAVKRLPAVSLNSLLTPLDSVDLLDMDVQGAELKVLTAAPDQLERKVKRVHVATHGSDLENGLRQWFKDLGWRNIHDFPHQRKTMTLWGPITFQDGVQTWVNPRCVGAASG